MGRGNCCVTGPYEGLYYIDNDDMYVYCREDDYSVAALLRDIPYEEIDEWRFDDVGTMYEQEDILECFIDDFVRRFPSFHRVKPEKWLDRERQAILENELFYVATEDNEWSVAIELIQKDDDYGTITGLQAGKHIKYLEGMKEALLKRLPSIGAYGGAWTHRVIQREVKIK